ncbi:MAG: hypothetical protein DIJKHBIC_03550 [Thermoanaerobaculia bacterium]|nr:hypothetical protein [Thermoanaerobaculia bacterium]
MFEASDLWCCAARSLPRGPCREVAVADPEGRPISIWGCRYPIGLDDGVAGGSLARVGGLGLEAFWVIRLRVGAGGFLLAGFLASGGLAGKAALA